MATVNRLSVVVPVHNEEENISPLIAEITAALKGKIDFEVLVVNDASTDLTASQLVELQQHYSLLRVIHHPQQAGQSAAVLSGVKFARFPWIATLDGDGQNNPLDILKLIQASMERPDPAKSLPEGCTRQQHATAALLCMGYRQKRYDGLMRKISSKLANQIRRLVLKDESPDSACGIKLFPRELYLTLPHFRNEHRFLPALFTRAGAKVIYVPVSHRPRLRGQSKYGLINRLGVGIMDLLGVAWLMRRKIDVEGSEDARPS